MIFRRKVIVALIGILFCTTNITASDKLKINENVSQGKKVLYVYGGWYGH